MQSSSSAAKYLQGLPSFNENNFARYQADSSYKLGSKRPTVYLPTKDHPAEQGMRIGCCSLVLRHALLFEQ